jgi:predicted permease
MPDWSAYVRQNLNLPDVLPADEATVVEEIARQLDDAYQEALNSGLSSEEAAAQAKLHITDWKSISAALAHRRVGHREMRARMGLGEQVDSLSRDIRYATRSLRKSAVFTVIAVLTLGLGIGANTAIFSAINALLLNPVGLPDSGRILAFGVNYEKLSIRGTTVSIAEFMDIRDSKDTFAAAAISAPANYNYSTGDFPERLQCQRVSWQWFEVFGVRPMIGRTFTAEEDQMNMNRVVILHYATWQRLFGGDPSIIGKTIELNQQPHKVIGVMPPEFHFRQTALWVPLGLPATAYTVRSRFNEGYELVARMKPGVSFKQAIAQVRLLTDRVHQQTDRAGELARNNRWSISARPYVEFVAGDLKSPMFVLMGAVGFILLIACANVAGLVTARAANQTRELALRSALGAGRWRLIRQALIETILIAASGLLAGLLLAWGGIRVLPAIAPEDLVGLTIRLDLTVLGFTALIALSSGIFFGFIPALQIGCGHSLESLKEGGRFATPTRQQLRFRSMLVTMEIALALILLVGAGLFLRSLTYLQQVDTGFDARGVMTGIVSLPPLQYQETAKQIVFQRMLLERLSNTPGVTAAATGIPIPFAGDAGGAFVIEGIAPQPGQPSFQGRLRVVSPEYFRTLGIPLISGRPFTDEDTLESEPVVIIDEALARKYWPKEDPIGTRIRRTTANAPWTKIVGIVRHVKHTELAADSDQGVHYYPAYQTRNFPTFAVLVRTTLGPNQVTNAIRQAVRTTDPAQSVYDLQSMEDRVLANLGSRRFAVQLLILFSGMAIFMAAIGLYGLISYLVAQRTHEIGIRMALGARAGQILGLILRQAMRMAIAGVSIGVIGAFILARFLSNQLFQVRSFDPATFGLMAAMVLLVAFVACVLPARRATAVDPLDACRHE